MSRRYFTLAVYENGRWGPQFGDYDRETVKYELEDYVDQGHRRKHLRIIETGNKQVDVNAGIEALNKVVRS